MSFFFLEFVFQMVYAVWVMFICMLDLVIFVHLLNHGSVMLVNS